LAAHVNASLMTLTLAKAALRPTQAEAQPLSCATVSFAGLELGIVNQSGGASPKYPPHPKMAAQQPELFLASGN
jgi:hypothetical protein